MHRAVSGARPSKSIAAAAASAVPSHSIIALRSSTDFVVSVVFWIFACSATVTHERRYY